MNDLKLYNGINNIDDDLIEEADRKQKPVIHHCYPIAASAAAIFIAVGAAGVFHNGKPARKPVIPENEIITAESTTSPATTTSSAKTSSATSQTIRRTPVTQTTTSSTKISTASTVGSSAVSTQPPVSYSKTSEIKNVSHPQTTARSVNVTQTEASVNVTSTTISSVVQNCDFEYEGSIIMKKYAAALTAILAVTNSITPIQSQAESYEPEIHPYATTTKRFIEEFDVDLDLNSDGNIDIFDLYAFYRCYVGRTYLVPEPIKEKYDAMPKKREGEKEETVIIDGMTFYQPPFYLDDNHLSTYFFTFYGIKPEYFDPNYYLDNCPDNYNDPVPNDVIKQAVKDVDKWDIFKLCRTSDYVKNEDGTYRPFNEDDVAHAYYYNEEYERYEPDNNFFAYNVESSPVHGFISYLLSSVIPDFKSNELMGNLISSGALDPDINSDGVYDFDDIVIAAHYADSYIYEGTMDRDIFHYAFTHTFSSDYNEKYPAELRESPDCPITEDEWNKANEFMNTARYYFEDDYLILMYMAENYLASHTVDDKYFDPVYYEKNHFAHFEYDKYGLSSANKSSGFLNILGHFKSFSIKNGPDKDKYKALIEESEKHEKFTTDEVNDAFPQYYKNVKTGALPQPDIDLDGKVGISDYLLLDNIDYNYLSLGGYDSFDSLAFLHPEVMAEMDISEETKENYQKNFDFNNNGISCDFLETECMRMYIFGELLSQYEDEEALLTAMTDYRNEHPEIVYYKVSDEKMEEFIKNNDVGFTKKADESEDETDFSESVEIIKNYSSFNQIYNAPEGIKGDANGDGKVDLSDAVLIMQSLANPEKYGVNGSDEKHITEEGYRLADIDGDGVTNMDALEIQKSLLGLTTIE